MGSLGCWSKDQTGAVRPEFCIIQRNFLQRWKGFSSAQEGSHDPARVQSLRHVAGLNRCMPYAYGTSKLSTITKMQTVSSRTYTDPMLGGYLGYTGLSNM